MKISTPDLCDQYENDDLVEIQVLDSIFTSYGGCEQFFGQIVTIKCFEDNSLLKELAGTPGKGRVIVMDGGGSQRRAILGDMIATNAVNNGWAGLIINGCVRDVDELTTINIGVKALNTHPIKTDKRGIGDSNVAVTFAGQTIKPGQWVYADNNGVIVTDKELQFDR